MKYVEKDKNIQLINGDCIKILTNMESKSIDMIFANPPYFLSNNGITCKNGKMVSVNKGDWDKSNGFEKDILFHRSWIEACDRVLKDDGTMWISGTYHCIHQIVYILLSMGYYIINEVAWFKRNAAPNLGCRCLTASQETLIWVKKCKKAKHTFNYAISKELNGGKQMRTVWEINTTPKNEKLLGKHPTQKPKKLLDRIIKIASKKGDLILNPFCGSSTTGVCAVENDRRYIGIDINKDYIELSKLRIKEVTKE